MTLCDILAYCKSGQKTITMCYDANRDGILFCVTKGKLQESITVPRYELDSIMNMERILRSLDLLFDIVESESCADKAEF